MMVRIGASSEAQSFKVCSQYLWLSLGWSSEAAYDAGLINLDLFNVGIRCARRARDLVCVFLGESSLILAVQDVGLVI